MAQVVLSTVGGMVGGGVGRVLGGLVGRAVDNSLVASLSPARQIGPRLEGLKLQSTAEGAPQPCVFGAARVAGQVIWAARFLERRHESRGSKGGARTVDYAYSLSFAVAVGEGPIDGLGRVWADGQPMDLSGVAMRVYRGTEDQTPDPLIEAVEGAAPAYRGTAYVVFEDLALDAWGDRPPQLSFEVFRRPAGGFAERLTGVCLIPGAGEFALATETVMRREGLTVSRAENAANGEGRPDLLVSLDHLQATFPNLRRVSLVVGWFGDDLRAGHCTIRPGVERRDKATSPQTWSVAGLTREDARLVSRHAGTPAYGGTPSDDSVRQAVTELKRRGLEVTLYPFVFMDVPTDNELPDPYGGVRQAAYPWRGRIRAEDGAEATAQIEALFGEADGWGLRRIALHYAALAAETGANALLIGSEMRGVTWGRDAEGGHPAVAMLAALAAECRALAGPDVRLSYAADWSEYFGHHDGDDVVFHLDPLWADPNVDFIGIDWYPPVTDWRGSDGGIDSGTFAGPADRDYLAAGVAGGEGFDWYYADDVDRAAQVRTPIIDTAHGEDRVFRCKDLAGWWANAHHDRPSGVRAASPTAWVPGMKPIRLTEFGCAAVDRGGNAPNLFLDPKSAESHLPPGSNGARSDAVQRGALAAILEHYDDPAANPVSAIYGAPMLEGADAWCWDARPWPAFPARSDLWADAGGWRTGHWLNGRAGGSGADLAAAVLRRAGLGDDEFTVEGLGDGVSGYLIDGPMRGRDAIEPLLTAFGATASERDGRVVIEAGGPVVRALAIDDLAIREEAAALALDRRLEPTPVEARVRFIDEASAFQIGAVSARGETGEGGGVDIDLPLVCSSALAEGVAARVLAADREALRIDLGPEDALMLEAGDRVLVEGCEGDWRIDSIDHGETVSALLTRGGSDGDVVDSEIRWRESEPPTRIGAPFLRLLDLPALPGAEHETALLAAVAAEPWAPMRVFAGPTVEAMTMRGTAARPATVGVLTAALGSGPNGRWDETNRLLIRFEGARPESRDPTAVLAGGNTLAVESGDGWELVQYRDAGLTDNADWELRGLLRGLLGTEVEGVALAGSVVVVLDEALARVGSGAAERGLPLLWRAGPADRALASPVMAERMETYRGVCDRPWAPAHLRCEALADGVSISWIARARRFGDAWDGEPPPSDPARFRIRLLADGETRRSVEVGEAGWTYEAALMDEDFPDGLADAEVAVAQWGEAWGWGREARRPLG